MNKQIEELLRYQGLSKYIFTFGLSHEHAGYYLVVWAKDFVEARYLMYEYYESKWAFQYTEAQWKESEKEAHARGEQLEQSLNHCMIAGKEI